MAPVRPRRDASSARRPWSSFQSRRTVSSKDVEAASSSTRKPAMTSSPRSPSTMLRRVSAATMPSRPLFTCVMFMSRNLGLIYPSVNIDPMINV